MTAGITSHTDSLFMQRCIQLARLGGGRVAPNPMVGAVLVWKGQIIGEGYHEQYGQAHAEVNCIQRAIGAGHSDKIAESVLYVSLEPCAHHGKTPPCADLIIRYRIPAVVIGSRDPFKQVDGKGIGKLEAAGVQVTLDVLKEECLELNKRFFTFHTLQRPYIILKWAQTADGIVGTPGKRLMISNAYSNRMVHRWRSEEQAIMVGTNTARADNPSLDTRFWPGPSPVRVVVDMDLTLPPSLNLFSPGGKTIVFNTRKSGQNGAVHYWQVTRDSGLVGQVLEGLKAHGIQSVLVEGGARLLQSFIDEKCWDEIRLIRSRITAGDGLSAPRIYNAGLSEEMLLDTDTLQFFKPVKEKEINAP